MAYDMGHVLFRNPLGCHPIASQPQFAENELEPELEDLMHDDEVQLVFRQTGIVAVHPALKPQERKEAKIIPVGKRYGLGHKIRLGCSYVNSAISWRGGHRVAARARISEIPMSTLCETF